MSPELSVTLAGFVAWCREHIRGDEKGEAQLYPDPTRLITPDCLGAGSDAVRAEALP